MWRLAETRHLSLSVLMMGVGGGFAFLAREIVSPLLDWLDAFSAENLMFVTVVGVPIALLALAEERFLWNTILRSSGPGILGMSFGFGVGMAILLAYKP